LRISKVRQEQSQSVAQERRLQANFPIAYSCARAFRDVGASLAITYLTDKASPLGDDPLGYRGATVGRIGPPSLAAWARDPLREDRSPYGRARRLMAKVR
jgi:hypothetical protein